MKILLGFQSYEGDSTSAVGQRLINLYAEKNPDIAGMTGSEYKQGTQLMVGSKYPWTLYGTPGQTLWLDMLSNSSIQGMETMGGLLYVVTGNDVFKVTPAGVKTKMGTITGAGGIVSMANNGTQIAIVADDTTGWVVTSADFAQITDMNFPGATSVCYLQSFGIFSTPDSIQFFISKGYDFTTYNSLFASVISSPSNLVSVVSFNGLLWLFTGTSYEVWQNVGAALFPFQIIPGDANTTRGLAARDSVVQDNNTMYVLADDRVVYTFTGITPQRISTHAIESQIQKFGTVSDAIGYSYTQRGHKFYCLTFPTAGWTAVYDIAQGLWHERQTFGSSRWNPNSIVEFAGKVLVGDFQNGKIFSIDPYIYQDAGQPIERLVQGATTWEESMRITHDRVHLDIDTGVGLQVGQGSDPQVVMTYSDDGGNKWSNERWRSFGAVGKYKTRCVWRRNGQSRQRIYQWKITDPVPVRINGAYGDFRIGRA